MHLRARWSGLRAIAQNTTILTVVFGGVVVLGLPESLLTDDASCTPARQAAISMGQIFVYAVVATTLLSVSYALLVPDQIRDYKNIAEYVSINTTKPKPTKEEILVDNWTSANEDLMRPAARFTVVFFAICSILSFGTFGYKVLNFLEASRACTPPAEQPLPDRVNIVQLPPAPCRHSHR